MALPKADWNKKWAGIVAQAWADQKFKKRLLADPAGVLKQHGIEIPPGVQAKIVENTDQLIHLALPHKPSAEEVAEEQLELIRGGASEFVITKTVDKPSSL